jgi:mono/diheme cytochrome c family protein
MAPTCQRNPAMQIVILAAALSLLAQPVSLRAAGKSGSPVDFRREVLPILSANCFSCHGPDEQARKGKLRLDLREDAVRQRSDGFAIKPGDPRRSEVVARVRSTDPDQVMPPPKSGHHLEPAQMDILERWIAQGAPYAEHWAFVPPQRPPVPKVRGSSIRIQNPIDAFVAATLKEAKLKQSPPADPHTLVRRLSLDLIGLPPTPEEAATFVADYRASSRNPQPAIERLVDRLLASPHFGERWARVWLDLARYADSAGYGSDPLRLNIWPYRDWLINAFNRNLPYDQFTLEQIAGDLLPNATPEQITATAFHRNTMTNTEGGTDDEEFRIAAVKDRVGTTVQVWMGLTMNCAQCHTHKYDPITQREYYQLYAMFNQTEDNDQPDERPTMPVYSADQRKQTERINAELAALEKQYDSLPPAFFTELAAWEEQQRKGVDWQVLKLDQLTSLQGVRFQTLEDGSVLATNKAPDKDTYTMRANVALPGITAIRLEALPHDSLPGNGPGRAGGNFVLSDLKLTATSLKAASKRARYVRVDLPGDGRILSLAEVQVFNDGENLAPKGKASQSSTDYDGPAHLAIDGNTDGDFAKAKSTTHTRTETDPWWELDLGEEMAVGEIVVWNRSDGNVHTRLSNFKVLALDAARKPVYQTTVKEPPTYWVKLPTAGQQNVALANATATFSQSDFDVSEAIAGKADQPNGWAIGGATGKAHTAIFECATKVGEEGGTQLRFTLTQIYGGGHTLGRFRLSATSHPKPVRVLPAEIEAILALVPEQRTEAQRKAMHAYYRPFASSLSGLNQQVAAKRKELDAIKPVMLPVLKEVALDKRRDTRIQVRGNFLDLGDKVEPGFPSAFRQQAKETSASRLDVAHWLVSRANPLTARVAVNRFWAQLFGTGLVETEEDYGTQGKLPSHPELLDWLAMEFMDRDWDMKAILKTIVLSATYQQSSVTLPEHLEKDPQARLLSRYPRRRLDAEGVRDQALALSGLLSRKVGGPSVYPPQPDGLWRAAFNGQRDYPTSKGEDRYRRGLYTFWRRTVPYPSMQTFDAPSRETCSIRRLPSNTPLQALVTLNDPAFVEMAQSLARRILKEGGSTSAERARYGLQLCLVRSPNTEQINALVSLYEEELAHYRANADAAKKLATEPLGALPEGLDAAEAAAWTVVANVLLNLDGVLAKG